MFRLPSLGSADRMINPSASRSAIGRVSDWSRWRSSTAIRDGVPFFSPTKLLSTAILLLLNADKPLSTRRRRAKRNTADLRRGAISSILVSFSTKKGYHTEIIVLISRHVKSSILGVSCR